MKAPAMYPGPLSVAEHGSDRDPVTPVEAQHLVHEEGRDLALGAQEDGDEGAADEDVDSGELVHLAHTLQLADAERIDTDEFARIALARQNPKDSSFLAASVTSPVVGATTTGQRVAVVKAASHVHSHRRRES
jgi:hypothetical protein